MKETNQKLGLLVAALISAGQIASADTKTEDFIPLEALTPSQRIALEPSIHILDQSFKVDWDSVALGVNHKGELILRERNRLVGVEQPSCWAQE